jgi:hypothetical protein
MKAYNATDSEAIITEKAGEDESVAQLTSQMNSMMSPDDFADRQRAFR